MRKECKYCKGRGWVWVMCGEEPEKDMCIDCNGDGFVEENTESDRRVGEE